MLHVAVLVHRHASLGGNTYWLRAISECWLEKGIRVSEISDPRAHIAADLAILHVDLTIIPRAYLDCARRFAVTVNGEVSDISKRAISANLLRRGDRYEGPVMVKTNRNCGGYPEMVIARNGWASRGRGDIVGSSLGYLKEKYRRARHRRRHGSASAFLDYPVFDSMTKVPAAVWSDDDLVVERFLPERINGRYCVRTWLFLGGQDRHAIFYAHDPVIKSHNIVGYERLSEVPEELRQMRRDLKFDFGKFDYAMVDGRPVLFDANRTPTFGDVSRERYLPVAQSLAGGIDAFLRNPRDVKQQPPASPEPAIASEWRTHGTRDIHGLGRPSLQAPRSTPHGT